MKVATRVLPVTPGERPELAAIEANMVAQRGAISPLYQMLLNSAPLATGWEQLLTAVRNQSSVPADLRELVILRVATLNRAPFEFAAHVPHARRSGVTFESTDGTINHNFRTLIIDASGHLQMVFPTTGDLSDQIVAEIIKAAGAPTTSVANLPASAPRPPH